MVALIQRLAAVGNQQQQHHHSHGAELGHETVSAWSSVGPLESDSAAALDPELARLSLLSAPVMPSASAGAGMMTGSPGAGGGMQQRADMDLSKSSAAVVQTASPPHSRGPHDVKLPLGDSSRSFGAFNLDDLRDCLLSGRGEDLMESLVMLFLSRVHGLPVAEFGGFTQHVRPAARSDRMDSQRSDLGYQSTEPDHAVSGAAASSVPSGVKQESGAGSDSVGWISWQDSKGRQLLHYASGLGYTNLIGLLVQLGANVNCQDLQGQTPLHVAVNVGDGISAATLLSYGVGLDIA